ncbi:MAG: isoprenylcysteine carboxylmethyltransferase family protein [Anaerolineales bacterium]
MIAIKSYGFITIAGVLLVVQYILGFFVYKLPGIEVLQWIGCVIWVLSGIFGFAPIFILRQKGGVAKGKSYVETKRLVDTSLYAIVRHPQYLAGILFGIAMMLLAQHWLVVFLGVISAVLIWLDIQIADQQGIEKFGEEYRRYMERVPQTNFIIGIARLMRSRKIIR